MWSMSSPRRLTNPLIELLKNNPKAMFDVLELRHALEEVAAYFAAATRHRRRPGNSALPVRGSGRYPARLA
jgi:DNA-binding FadR family transcriptional regulator